MALKETTVAIAVVAIISAAAVVGIVMMNDQSRPAGETFTIKGLPGGTRYTVTENDATGYTSSIANATGRIGTYDSAIANNVTLTATNTRDKGELKLSKTVSGATATDKVFYFTVLRNGVYYYLNEEQELATTTTAPQLATVISLGEADAAIVWKENCKADGVEILDTPDMASYIKTVPAARLRLW